MRRTAEFDAFGPWVVRVRDEEDLPPLYRDHEVDLGADVVLKVPRDITRRDANPDMDLYDHLVVAGSDGLTLLSRRPSAPGYDVRSVPWDRIAVVRTGVELLDGSFSAVDLEHREAPVTFRFNGSSYDEVQAFAREVRERAAVAGSPLTWSGPSADLDLHTFEPHDVALVTTQRSLVAENPDLVTVVGHPRRTVRRVGGRTAALLDALVPVTLHGLVVSASPGEVHLVHRRRWTTTSRRPVHSLVHTALVQPRVTEVRVRDSDRWAEVDVVEVRSGAARLEVPVARATGTADPLTRTLRG